MSLKVLPVLIRLSEILWSAAGHILAIANTDSKQAQKSQLSMHIWPTCPIKNDKQNLKRQDNVSLAVYSGTFHSKKWLKVSTDKRAALKQSAPT